MCDEEEIVEKRIVSGVAYSRSTGQVLNIAFLDRMAVDRGGFFPVGVNGTLRSSTAN